LGKWGKQKTSLLCMACKVYFKQAAIMLGYYLNGFGAWQAVNGNR
jgi:hypothetical protein